MPRHVEAHIGSGAHFNESRMYTSIMARRFGEPEGHEGILALLESIGKAGVAGVAICYALGLLIKNMYLALWSTFSTKLIEAEYVLTGALFVMIFLLGISFWTVFLGTIRRVRLRRNRAMALNPSAARWRARIGVIVVFTLLLSLVIAGLSIISDGFLALRMSALACVGILLLPAAVVLARESIAETWHEAVLKRDVAGQRQAGWFFVALAIFVAVVIHAFVIYPNVSPAFGGGRHEPVSVYVKPDVAKLLREMKFTADASDSNLFAAEVIFEDDEYVALVASDAAPSRTAVRLKRDQVQSIITRPILALRTIRPRIR